jgi:hypothetical protein
LLKFFLVEDNTAHLVKLIVGPIVDDSLHLEPGIDQFAYQDALRHTVSDPVFWDALWNN